jgi:hypothetical protein
MKRSFARGFLSLRKAECHAFMPVTAEFRVQISSMHSPKIVLFWLVNPNFAN